MWICIVGSLLAYFADFDVAPFVEADRERVAFVPASLVNVLDGDADGVLTLVMLQFGHKTLPY